MGMLETPKLKLTYKKAISHGKVELACALQPLLYDTDNGKDAVQSVVKEVVSLLTDTKNDTNGPGGCEPVFVALRLLSNVNEAGIDTTIELLQAKLLLSQSQNLLSETAITFIKGVLFTSKEFSIRRRIGNFVTVNPTLLDICQKIPELPTPFLKFFNSSIVENANLEEAYQSTLVNCLKRIVQKNKTLPAESLIRYLKVINTNQMGKDVVNSLQSCLVHFLKEVQVNEPDKLYKLCIGSFLKDGNTSRLALALKEERQDDRLTTPLTSHISTSYQALLIAALYETLDMKQSFIEEVIQAGLKHLQNKEYDRVREIFGESQLRKLKPLLLGVIWDRVDSHEEQAALLEELSYNASPKDKFVRSVFRNVGDQVKVGKWCEEQVRPLLKDSWDGAAAATVTSSRSILQVVLALNCIEKLGQSKVLGLMFNDKDKDVADPNDFPLSDALTYDQGKDIVTFCSAMVILNIVEWLNKQQVSSEDDTESDELMLAGKHLSRVWPLHSRAEVLLTAFSALVHAMQVPKCGLKLQHCLDLVDWFDKQLQQFEKDEKGLSLGHFDAVKIFKDLSIDAPSHHPYYNLVKETVAETKWRIGLLKTLTETKSRKRRELSRLISASLLSFICSTPQDLLRLCLISENTGRATETLARYDMKTTHLALVVDFQNDYARCVKELEQFGASIKKLQGPNLQSIAEIASPVSSKTASSIHDSSRSRGLSVSSTSSSITSTISRASRTLSVASIAPSLRNIAVAAARSGEKSKVPAIVSKLTSTVSVEQLMIECAEFVVDKETLIARLYADLGCAVTAPKTVGLQLVSLALERLQDNIVPDSPIEVYIKKIYSIMKMLDSKPFPGISIASSSPKDYLNSIYPCISHDVLQALLEFNENQAVTYTDLKNAVNDKGPLDVVRMQGVLESARDVLNRDNYTTFLSTHDKHRDYLGNLIAYLKEYVTKFNINLEETPSKVLFSPSQILNKSPEYHLGELILRENVHPKMLTEAADYLSVDLLQLLVISSFPKVCIEEASPVLPDKVTLHLPPVSSGGDNEKAAIILNLLVNSMRHLPDSHKLPQHLLISHLERSVFVFEEHNYPAIDLLRILTSTISHHKHISCLKPSGFSPIHILGLCTNGTELDPDILEEQITSHTMSWTTLNTSFVKKSEVHLTIHPLCLLALTLIRQSKRSKLHLREFYQQYFDIYFEGLGVSVTQIEELLECKKDEIWIQEESGIFYLQHGNKKKKIVITSPVDYNFESDCRKCKDILNEGYVFRAELKPMTSAYDFIKGHNECLASLGYMFNALDYKELYGAGVIIDDTLLSFPALQQYVTLRAAPYLKTVTKEFVNIVDAARDDPARDLDVIGCQLFGGPRNKFLVFITNSLIEYSLKVGRYFEAYEIMSSDSAKDIYGDVIPDTILLLAMEKRTPAAPDFVSFFVKLQDKLLGLEFARVRYQDWPVPIAMECFTYFSEVLADQPDCSEMIHQCLDRLTTMDRIGKILNHLETISLNTCRTIEDFIMRRSEDFTQTMTAHKEFAVCHSAIKLGILPGHYEAKLLAEHVIFMAQNDNFDTLDIYNLLEKKVNIEVCETLCSLVTLHTNNLKIVLQLIDVILDKFQTLLTEDKVIVLKKQRLGALCYREIKLRKVPQSEEYSQLIFRPLILIEQLVMNFQIHNAATVVKQFYDQYTECDLISSLNTLIKLYIGKALFYEGARQSESSGSTAYSTISRVTTASRPAKRQPLVVFDPPFKGTRSRSNSRALERSKSRRISKRENQFIVPTCPAQWVDDKKVRKCQTCRVKFTFIVRKHHCRWCGRVLCDKCVPLRPPTSYFGASVRLCDPCYGAVQEGRYSAEGGEGNITDDMNTLYSPPFEVLSTNAEYNLDTRQSFSFTTAPSSELCLYLSRMLSDSSPPGEVLLPLCEALSETVMDSIGLDVDRNYGSVLGVMENVLKEARNCFRRRAISKKLDTANIYITYISICRRLPLSDLAGFPPMKHLLKFDTLNTTYMKLLDRQYPQLAINLCTAARKDPVGLWRRWGFQCLRAGDYPAARDKLEKCLRNKQYNQAILDEVIHHLENCVPSFLAETTDVTEFITDIRRKCKKHKIGSAEFDECVYYLSSYATPVSLLKFYIQHNAILRATELGLQYEHDTLYQGIIKPLIKMGKLSSLFDHIKSNRSEVPEWQGKLSDCCKLLTEAGDLTSVYTVQLFLEEFLNAAKTSILMLKQELSVKEQSKYLDKAEDCFKAYLEKRSGADETIMPEVNTRLSHIHLQRQILDFLELKNIKDNDRSIHIFSPKIDKTVIGLELYKIDYIDSLPIIRAIRQVFSRSYDETYLPIISYLLKTDTTGNISLWFPRLIKILGEVPDKDTDRILLTVSKDLKDDFKSFEKILAIMKDDKTKIRANVSAGFLKNAYILAANKKLRDVIVWLEEECVKQGDTQVREFCRKYLQHNIAKI